MAKHHNLKFSDDAAFDGEKTSNYVVAESGEFFDHVGFLWIRTPRDARIIIRLGRSIWWSIIPELRADSTAHNTSPRYQAISSYDKLGLNSMLSSSLSIERTIIMCKHTPHDFYEHFSLGTIKKLMLNS